MPNEGPDHPGNNAAWEAEVKAMSDRLARESRRSALHGFLGGLVVMAGVIILGFAAWQANQRLTSEKTANKSLTEDVQKKSSQVTSAQEATHTVGSVLGATLSSLVAQGSDANPALNKAIDADPNAAKLIPRAYIHMHSAAQRSRALALAAVLVKAGYVVPGIDVQASTYDNQPRAYQQTQVHYYTADDQSVADTSAIAALLTQAGAPAEPSKVAPSPNDKLRPRAYGIWLARDLR